MGLKTFACLVLAIPAVIYFLIYEINWQWEGFDKIKKWFKESEWFK